MARRSSPPPARNPSPAQEPKPAPPWLNPLLLGLAAIFLLGLFSTEFADSDAWWQLKTGAYIAAKHRLPYPDPFAYTTKLVQPAYPGELSVQRFNLTHEWLAQTLMYAWYAVGGFGAVILWKALLLTMTCALVGFIAWLRTRSQMWALAAALAASPALLPFAHDRPTIVTFLFVAAFIAVFEDRKRLWLLPALALVWANCHGGFFLAWVICGAYCADALLRRAPGVRKVFLFSGVAFLVSGINPNGFRVAATLLAYRQSHMTSTLLEWAKPGFWGEPYAFFILLYTCAAVLIVSWRKVRISDWLLFAAFTAAAMSAYRNIPLVAVVAPFLAASYFPWKSTRPLPRAVPYAAALALLAGVVYGCVTGAFFQLRAATWRFPEGAANFMLAHGLTYRVFNTYEQGGYLIWRGIPTFIDGRSLSDNLFVDYGRILGTQPGDPRRDPVIDRYQIQTIVLNGFEYSSGVLYPLAIALMQPAESQWNLVYDDAAAMVFVRNLPPGVAPMSKGRILDHLETECVTHIAREPSLSLCARTLGDLFAQSDPGRARRNFALYLDHPYDGDDPVARQRYLQLVGR